MPDISGLHEFRGGSLPQDYPMQISLRRIRTGLRSLVRERVGACFAEIIRRIRKLNRNRLEHRKASGQPQDRSYASWVMQYDTITPHVMQSLLNRLNRVSPQSAIAILMPVYNPRPEWLRAAIDSVKKQIYQNWELCISDDASTNSEVRDILEYEAARDGRIKLCQRKEHGNISVNTNSALELVTATYVGVLGQHDVLGQHALLFMAEAIAYRPNARLLYSDEDKISPKGTRCAPRFKPDWNPELLLGQNYLGHLTLFKTQHAREIGGVRPGYEGAQEHDFFLRYTEGLGDSQIIHLPFVLYHSRQYEVGMASGVRAVQEALGRRGQSGVVDLDAQGWYHVRFEPLKEAPLVSLIIPTRNGLDVLRACVESIIEKTTDTRFEIIIVDNGSDDPGVLSYLDALIKNKPFIRVLRDEGPFNYSALNNRAAAIAKGEYIALINNDIEVISPGWLTEMVCLAAQPGVGAVGARLLYGNTSLQHGGVILGIGGVAGHAHKHFSRKNAGYMGRAKLLQTVSAVTAACLVVKKQIFDQIGGLDEQSLKVAFNDIDFCLRLREAGYRNIWTPHAELFHHESVSRGSDAAPDKRRRITQEFEYMRASWGELLMQDTAYNPNLTLEYEDFGLAWPPRTKLGQPWFGQVPSPLGEA